MTRRRKDSIVPLHTTWGMVFVAACCGLAIGSAITIVILWAVMH